MFLGSGGRNESNSHQLARIGEKKIFHELDVCHRRVWVGGRNQSNKACSQKIFHELDVHHVQKVGIKRVWAQEAEMSHQLARIGGKKIFHELDASCLESRNQTCLGSGGQKLV